MKVSLFLDTFTPKNGPEDVKAVAAAAESAGIHGVWVSEHAVLFENYESPYPFTPDKKWKVEVGAGLPDPFVLLSMLSGVTERLKLGTAIVILPERNPVQTAKLASDLDFISGGRMRLGVGLGWSKEEYDALQVPWERRGERADEYLTVMRGLWEKPVAGFTGEFYEHPEAFLYPKSIQKPHVPIYICTGGQKMSAKQLTRTATHASGWIGLEVTPDEVAAQVRDLGKALAERGRELADLEIIVGPPASLIASTSEAELSVLQPYVDAGVTELVLVMGAETTAASIEQIRTFGASVVKWAASK